MTTKRALTVPEELLEDGRLVHEFLERTMAASRARSLRWADGLCPQARGEVDPAGVTEWCVRDADHAGVHVTEQGRWFIVEPHVRPPSPQSHPLEWWRHFKGTHQLAPWQEDMLKALASGERIFLMPPRRHGHNARTVEWLTETLAPFIEALDEEQAEW